MSNGLSYFFPSYTPTIASAAPTDVGSPWRLMNGLILINVDKYFLWHNLQEEKKMKDKESDFASKDGNGKTEKKNHIELWNVRGGSGPLEKWHKEDLLAY